MHVKGQALVQEGACMHETGWRKGGRREMPLVNSPDWESQNRALLVLENKVAMLLDVVFPRKSLNRTSRERIQSLWSYYMNFNRGGHFSLTEAGKPTASLQRSRLIVALIETVGQPSRLIG